MRHVWSAGTLALDDRGPVIEGPAVLFEIARVSRDDPIIERHGDPDRLALYSRKFSEDTIVPPFKYSYGSRIGSQLHWAADLLRARPHSKSAWISLTTPGEPYDAVPCLIGLAFRIRNGTLVMTATFRSQNAYTSYLNYVPLADVHARMARTLRLERGPMRVFVDVPHLYLADSPQVLQVMRPAPPRRSSAARQWPQAPSARP
jgi:thymidylate synthase